MESEIGINLPHTLNGWLLEVGNHVFLCLGACLCVCVCVRVRFILRCGDQLSPTMS